MKEIKVLKQELRNFPDNWFVYPDHRPGENTLVGQDNGLIVCDLEGNTKGFIETGTNNGEVIR